MPFAHLVLDYHVAHSGRSPAGATSCFESTSFSAQLSSVSSSTTCFSFGSVYGYKRDQGRYSPKYVVENVQIGRRTGLRYPCKLGVSMQHRQAGCTPLGSSPDANHVAPTRLKGGSDETDAAELSAEIESDQSLIRALTSYWDHSRMCASPGDPTAKTRSCHP